MEEETMASRLWKKYSRESTLAMYSPFFVSLAAGNLDSQSFSHFLSQDVIFLEAIARAYKLAEECVDEDDEKKAILRVMEYVPLKLRKLDSFVKECGFKIPEENNPDAMTAKYTDFLLSTASGKVKGERVPCKIITPFERTKVGAYTIAVVAPLLRLYDCVFYVAKTYLDLLDSSYICKKWILHHTSREFKVAIWATENALEKLCVAFTGVDLELVEKLYTQALRIGIEFYRAQKISGVSLVPLSPMKESSNSKLTIFCDFDLTCTSVDSGAILAEMAIATTRGLPETSQLQISSDELRQKWNAVSETYTKEFEQCVRSIDDGEPGNEFDYEGLSNSLKQVSDFEKRANERVVESGVLKGISQSNIKLAGKTLVLRPGCKNFFQKILKTRADVHIISYCWCSDLIREAFSSDLDASNVHSNELAYKESITTGEIIRKVESPAEKLKYFSEVLNDRDSEAEHLTICIGGDVGDLLCLLEADIGIVISSGQSIKSVGHHFGVKFVPLFRSLVHKQRGMAEDSNNTWKPRSGVLYTVSAWIEIEAFILCCN